MRKIMIFFLFLVATYSFGQVSINENFDSGTPAGWTDSYANTTSQVCSGQSERDNIYSGSSTGNMTSPNQVAASNGTDITFSIDYKVVDWSAATNPTADGWGTADLQYSTDDGSNWITAGTIDDSNDSNSNVCTTFSVTILGASVPVGSDLRFRVFNTWAAGDYYFYIDDFEANQVALTPPNCDSSLTSATTDFPIDGTLTWSAATGGPTGYKISVGTTMGGTDIANNVDVGLTTSYAPLGLSYSTLYYATITPYNANGDATGCTEETFTVEDAPPAGTDCLNPIVIGALPYTTNDDTANYGDDFSGSPGSSGCGTTSSYLNGDDVVYAYTATADGTLNVSMDPVGTWSGIFVYTDCADIGTACIAGEANSGTAERNFDFSATNGTTYYFVISTFPSPQSTVYDLNITEVLCADPSGMSVSNITSSSADLTWTIGDSESDWNLEFKAGADFTPGTGAEDFADTASTTPAYSAMTLTANATYYVYYQANCGANQSAWIGPEIFTTLCSSITPEYFADMSVNVPDACWDEAGSGAPIAGPGSLGSSDWRQGTSYAEGSSNAINLFSNVDEEWLLSPTFDLSSGGPYQLELNVAVTDWNNGFTDDSMGSDDEVELLISTDGGASWTNLTAWNAGNEPDVAGTNYVEDLSSYSGNVQFAIWATDGTTDDSEDYDFHVGKFDVVNQPTSVTVDFCNLQFPGSDAIDEGDPFSPFARIFQDGVTQPAGASGLVEAWIGYSETDATVLADFETGAWTWVPATFNTQVGNDDEYSVDIGSGLAPGNYFYVSRFRVDNGVFAYGGNTAGPGEGGNFWDGTSFVSGQLTVNVTPPTTVATFDISGCGDSDSYSAAYNAGVDGIVWVELIYDGGCFEITTDTETTTGIDTEIGLYDSFGNRISNNDDGGTGTLSSITETGLAAGTYYIAAGAFNVTFNATNFDVTTANTTATGNLVINAGTPNLPDFVNLQFPGESTITTGGSQAVFAQIFETGVTPGAGAGAGITAEIGISATDATTTADFETVDWTWTTAPYFGEVGNNDEYSLDIGASLPVGTYYYVSRFSIDGGPFVYGGNTAGGAEGGDFWDGSSFVSGVLTVNPAAEPTNHVDSFAAAPDSDMEITLTWNDNDGTQPANGFLIVGRTGATPFYSPVDGTDPVDDTDFSDGDFEVQVLPGVETYTVTGLTASTLYEFEIYPFTNSGALIDFKTDATVPTASATTDGDPCLVAIDTFPFTEGFESGVPPQCWTSFRGANGLGTGFDWTTTTNSIYINSGSAAAFVRYENVTGGDAEDWLVTPLLDFGALTSPELTFFSRAQFGSFATEYTVRVSTTDTNIGSFTTVATYDETDLGSSISEFTVDLSAYAGENNVYVAFVMIQDDGDSWGLDDVTIQDNLPTTYTFNGTWTPTTPEGNATAADDIVIASGDYTMTVDMTCNRFDVLPGASLTVNGGTTLTLNDILQLQSNSTSYSSLILEGSVSGPILYDRHVNINGSGTTGNNDLISAPLTGQQFNQVAAGNPNILNNGTLYLFGPFSKATGTYVTWAGTETATLDAGIGYRAATSDNSVVTFSGTAENGPVGVAVSNSGPNNPEWNLVGNPYASYMDAASFLATNGGVFDPGTFGIWGYDGNAQNGWTLVNNANVGLFPLVAPGQGFFVSCAAPTNTINFDPSWRTSGSSDDYIPGRLAQPQYMVLNMVAGDKSFHTDFFFDPVASEGFDLGYDAEFFEAVSDFGIYSHLVQDNVGKAITLQTMNVSSLSDVTIPLGVHVNQGEQFTISISETTLPASVSVYLDDVVANTTTLLNNGDYTITPATDLSGTGRFFLRYSEDALSTVDNTLDSLNIFAQHNTQELVVSGQLQAETTLELYDIQGRKVMTAELDSDLIENRLDVSSLNTGVYVVTVANDNQNITKKVILK